MRSPGEAGPPAQGKQEAASLRIYHIVRQIPRGKVATYGQIAALAGNCTARMVGYAMAALQGDTTVPWQRVINAQGKVSPRADNAGADHQRSLLEQEGVVFGPHGRLDFRIFRWHGPSIEWLLENGFDPSPSWREQ